MEDVSRIVRTAIKMETDGIEFYGEAVNKVSHPFGKKMFLSLAKDEQRHLSVLKDILVDLDFSGFEKYFGETPQEKIKAVFDQLKDEMSQRITAQPSELEIIKMAMKVEEGSVEFYESSIEKTANQAARGLLERLVLEEKDHYTILENTYSFLENSGEWFLWEEKGILDGGEM